MSSGRTRSETKPFELLFVAGLSEQQHLSASAEVYRMLICDLDSSHAVETFLHSTLSNSGA